MINRQLSRLLLCSILGSTTLISGCALVRKDSAPHQQLKPEQIKLADDIHLASSGWPQAQWWKQLNDPQLDALIQRTLSGSHTLAEAKLREEKAQSQADLLDAGSQLQVAADVYKRQAQGNVGNGLGVTLATGDPSIIAPVSYTHLFRFTKAL